MKLVVLSRRNITSSPSAGNLEGPLEDAIASYDGATIVAPHALRRGNVRSSCPAWLSAIRVVRGADAVLWTQYHLRPDVALWGLAYVRPLARRALFAIDTWEPAVDDLARIASAQRVAACFVMFREAYLWIRARYPSVPVHWLPVAFNNERFQDPGADRDIFAFWMGRKHEPLRAALARYCDERGSRYVFEGYPVGNVLAELAARSRYFVVTPPDLDNPTRTGAFSPITLRYLEGAGAGCRLLGVAPGSGELETLLGETALVHCSETGGDVASALERAEADADWEQHRREAHRRAHADHTWERRARQVVETLALDA